MSLKTGYPELRGVRVCIDIVRKVARMARTPADGSRVLIANACNAVWTRSRATLAGYVVEDTICELCGQHEDTIHGRIWKCQHPDVKAARDKIAS